MISYELYKTIHITGLFMAFAALGGLLLHLAGGGTKENFSSKKLFSLTLGIGSFLALVAGFGLLARIERSATEGWVLAKLTIWTILVIYPIILYRRPKLSRILWFSLFALGLLAATLVQYKPF